MRSTMTRTSQRLLDLAALAASFLAAIGLRFDWDVPAVTKQMVFLVLPYVVAIQYGTLVAFRVPRFAWRHVSLRDVTRMFLALSVASALLVGLRLLAEVLSRDVVIARYATVPFGALLMHFLLSLVAIVGLRASRRLFVERIETTRRGRPSTPPVPTLLVGAGEAGRSVAREITARPDLGIRPVGFVDDDRAKLGTLVLGIPVLGTTADLPALARDHGATQVMLTIANAPGTLVRRVTALAKEANAKATVVPGLSEIVGGELNLSRIREVAIEDLLRREPVVLDDASIRDSITGRCVLVTGAGGSIGSELCRQLVRFRPSRLVLVERSETALFYIHRELVRGRWEEVELVPFIADVGDRARIRQAFSEHRPKVVFHAAAHKHVPMMEANPAEAIKNNVHGTASVADLALEHDVARFVLISTDKAVNPSSVMGATKRLAEMYTQSLNGEGTTRFVAVRFGNVLGSSGSVVPLFKEQIASGGPVEVTDPRMERFFMTIPEACQLVLQAGVIGDGGEIFVLDMGEPVRILDLARDLIRLSGLRPDEDIEVVFTGARPGEKLVEELSFDHENVSRTTHPKIFEGRIRAYRRQEVRRWLDGELSAFRLDGLPPEEVRARVRGAVPEFSQPRITPVSESDPASSARNDGESGVSTRDLVTVAAS